MTKRLRAILIAICLFGGVYGCSQFADSTPCVSGAVLTIPQLQSYFPGQYVITGDQTYAEVNPAFAPKWHEYMGSVMSLLGMAGNWSEQFDCNRFANVKLAVIHIRFLVDTWHSRQPGAGAAAGEMWFIPGAAPGGTLATANQGKPGHAILVTIEAGRRVFRDIYSPRELTLTPAEIQSAYLIKF